MVMGLAQSRGATVFNAHERVLPASVQVVGALLDRLGSEHDPIWPSDRWPRLELDRGGLVVGARGGHGPIRYHVVEYDPGRFVRFRFSAPPGFLGHHEFVVERSGEKGALLRHVVVLAPSGEARYTWPLIWRPLHDALMEDALDRAEAAITGTAPPSRAWSWWVRVLRRLLRSR